MKEEIYQVRPAIEEDNAGIRRVQVATWKSAYTGLIPDNVLEQLTDSNPPRRTKQPDEQNSRTRRAYVAVSAENEVVGFVVGGIARDHSWKFEAEVWAIYVLKSHQGLGLGKRLFQAVVVDLAESYSSMIIWVLKANVASHRFYEALGGKRLSLEKDFKWNDEPIAREVAYGWEEIREMTGHKNGGF